MLTVCRSIITVYMHIAFTLKVDVFGKYDGLNTCCCSYVYMVNTSIIFASIKAVSS